MLVMRATVGKRWRNEPSDSSASATSTSPWPSRAFEPKARALPPMMAVGSSPASARMTAIIVVVVVLPWLPATATPSLTRISSPSISARGMTGMLRARAAATSGLSARTALEMTTTSAWATFSGRWPNDEARAQRPQPSGHVALAQVRARHRIPEVEQHLGDARHADPADPHEMDGDVSLAEHQRPFNTARAALIA